MHLQDTTGVVYAISLLAFGCYCIMRPERIHSFAQRAEDAGWATRGRLEPHAGSRSVRRTGIVACALGALLVFAIVF